MNVNPVIGRELTERLRGMRAYLAVTFFVLVLALTMFLVFEGSEASAGRFDLSARTGVGRLVFETVILIMTGLVLFFVPGLTAGAIAGERERQTLATLQVTLLRPRSILAGKVAAALAYLLLLVVAGLPVLAVAYLLGGMQPRDIILGVLSVLLVAVVLAAMVVAVSTFAKRVQTATLLAYGFTALITAIGPLAYGISALLDQRWSETVSPPAWLLTINPLTLVADLGAGNRAGGDGPLTAIRQFVGEAKARNDGTWWAWFPEPVNWSRVDEADLAGRPLGSGPAAWVMSLVSLGLIAGALSLVAIRRLRTPAETER